MNFVNAFTLTINDISSHCYFQRDYRLHVNTKLRNNSLCYVVRIENTLENIFTDVTSGTPKEALSSS